MRSCASLPSSARAIPCGGGVATLQQHSPLADDGSTGRVLLHPTGPVPTRHFSEFHWNTHLTRRLRRCRLVCRCKLVPWSVRPDPLDSRRSLGPSQLPRWSTGTIREEVGFSPVVCTADRPTDRLPTDSPPVRPSASSCALLACLLTTAACATRPPAAQVLTPSPSQTLSYRFQPMVTSVPRTLLSVDTTELSVTGEPELPDEPLGR